MRRVLGLALLLAACAPDAVPDRSTLPLRFLALGDSYTIGEGLEPAERWPVGLANALRDEGVGLAEPEIVAETGWTTAELDAGLDAAAPEGPFDLVTLLVGVNDEYRGGTPEAFQPAFRAMLERAVAFAGGEGGRVVVVSIPDWSPTPFGAAHDRDAADIAAQIDAFNATARAEAARARTRWADVTGLSRTTATGTVGDGLHPDAAAVRAWLGPIGPEARAALGLHPPLGTARLD